MKFLGDIRSVIIIFIISLFEKRLLSRANPLDMELKVEGTNKHILKFDLLHIKLKVQRPTKTKYRNSKVYNLF